MAKFGVQEYTDRLRLLAKFRADQFTVSPLSWAKNYKLYAFLNSTLNCDGVIGVQS